MGPDSGAPEDDGGNEVEPDAASLDLEVSTLAGGSQPGQVDGARGVAAFHNPVNVAVGPGGDVFVADFDNSLIRRVTAAGEVTTVTDPRPDFYRPFGLAVLPDGRLFVQTDGNSEQRKDGALWEVDPDTGALEIHVDDVGRTRGLAALPDGRLAMADYQAHVIRIYDPDSGETSILAGALDSPGYTDDTGRRARFDVPYDLAVTSGGDLIVSDHENHRLRRVTMAGEVTTFAGTGSAGISDGQRREAEFFHPQGLAMADDGTLFVTDTGGYVVRRVSPDGQVETVAGDGQPGFRDGAPLEARFFGLEGIDVGPEFVYVADGNRGGDEPYHRVRRLDRSSL